MAIISISEASRQWHLGRSNLYRAVKSGRHSLSTRSDGSRGIDISELIRVFGEPFTGTTANVPHLSAKSVRTLDLNDREQVRTLSPVNLLQVQVNQLSTQLEQAQLEKTRLLTMLEAEQQARRNLEQKLLPTHAPQPKSQRQTRWWGWVLLLGALTALAVTHVWPDGVTLRFK